MCDQFKAVKFRARVDKIVIVFESYLSISTLLELAQALILYICRVERRGENIQTKSSFLKHSQCSLLLLPLQVTVAHSPSLEAPSSLICTP